MINGATLNQLFLTAKMKVAPTLKSFRETYVGNHNFPKSVFFFVDHIKPIIFRETLVWVCYFPKNMKSLS